MNHRLNCAKLKKCFLNVRSKEGDLNDGLKPWTARKLDSSEPAYESRSTRFLMSVDTKPKVKALINPDQKVQNT